MKNIAYALMIPAICLTLTAESTGRISAKLTTKGGKPIAGAKFLLERDRSEIQWAKEMTTDAEGHFMLVGLAPKEYTITITAEGYVPLKVLRRIPLGDSLTETFVLLTATEARATAPASADPSAAKAASGSEAFNSGISFYNEQKYAEALPFIATAYNNLSEALSTTTNTTTKTEMETRMPVLERVYGIVLAEVSRTDSPSAETAPDPAKLANATKAEPMLVHALERSPKDQRIVTCLLAVATTKQDAEAIKKYQDALDALIGPRPELIYNEAVVQFNAGNYKQAKTSVAKAILLDPKFADSYWLQGVVEFSLGSTKAAKESFKKYMEIAPTGKKASEVKEFLKELK